VPRFVWFFFAPNAPSGLCAKSARYANASLVRQQREIKKLWGFCVDEFNVLELDRDRIALLKTNPG
jgi:hypothetical protein